MARNRTSAAVYQTDAAPNSTDLGVVVRVVGGGTDNATIVGPLGRKADALSVSVALSTEDVAALGAITSIVPGTAATNLGKAEDSASADGDVGVGLLAVRKATPANTSGTDGDYEFLQMSAGRLWTNTTVGVAATDLGKAEDAAHTSGDTGVMSLGVLNQTPTALAGTNLDYIPFTFNTYGGLWSTLVDNAGVPVDFTGVTTIYRVPSAAATTNGANIKATSGHYYWVRGTNKAAYDVFVKLYNLATSPTVGSSTIYDTICIPAGGSIIAEFPQGVSFATGLSIAITKLVADADTTALIAGDVVALSVGYA